MSKIIIPPFLKENKKPQKEALNVSEFYYETIQGEGIYVGHPAVFLRLQGCVLNCSFCDTTEVWRTGNPYTYDELFDLMDTHNVVNLLHGGTHLVITGGSPLMQQFDLINFLEAFKDYYKFTPFIELENECVIMPDADLIKFISCWNNSPKLENSGNIIKSRYKEKVIQSTAQLKNSWFKFVVGSKEDLDEIYENYIKKDLISWEQLILMPKGDTKEELNKVNGIVAQLAAEISVKFSPRLHVEIWGKTVSI